MIIPSLDLIDGYIVRLKQGDYNQKQYFGKNPISRIKKYLFQGANLIHVVDLNGAKNPQQRQITLLKKLLKKFNGVLQIAGGIRSHQDIKELFYLGAKRIVIGSAIANTPEKIENWLKEFGSESITLALDIFIDKKNQKKIAVNGWTKTTELLFEEVLKKFQTYGLKHVLCTDISQDGTMNGPNVKLYQEIRKKYPTITFQASGGVSSLQDINILRKIGIQNVIVGRALLENIFTLSEAILCWQNE